MQQYLHHEVTAASPDAYFLVYCLVLFRPATWRGVVGNHTCRTVCGVAVVLYSPHAGGYSLPKTLSSYDWYHYSQRYLAWGMAR